MLEKLLGSFDHAHNFYDLFFMCVRFHYFTLCFGFLSFFLERGASQAGKKEKRPRGKAASFPFAVSLSRTLCLFCALLVIIIIFAWWTTSFPFVVSYLAFGAFCALFKSLGNRVHTKCDFMFAYFKLNLTRCILCGCCVN